MYTSKDMRPRSLPIRKKKYCIAQKHRLPSPPVDVITQTRRNKQPILLTEVLYDHCARILQRAARRSGLTEGGFVIL
jgi:hypothetical protein